MTKNWYAVHTYSGYEEKVKASIERNVERKNLKDKIGRILIPKEKVIELRSGKKKETTRKFYPGYILIEMELNDETWRLVNSTPRVTGFVGGDHPAPLHQEEVDVIVQQIERGTPPPVRAKFSVGDNVRITDGAFTNFNGYVDEVDEDHNRLRVMVTIFGRQTPVELNFMQVEKI